MPTSIIDDTDLALDRYDGNIFVITMRKAPENRLNSSYCQKLIRTFNLVRTTLGQDSEGAVITRGNDAKFWCTVSEQHQMIDDAVIHCWPCNSLKTNRHRLFKSTASMDLTFHPRAWNWTSLTPILLPTAPGSSLCSRPSPTFHSRPLR